MSHQNYITAYCHVKNGEVNINGTIDFTDNAIIQSVDFLKQIYKHYQLAYPKFYKMDSLCKLGILCTEFALQHSSFLTNTPLDKTAIVLSNSASSLETDRQYQSANYGSQCNR